MQSGGHTQNAYSALRTLGWLVRGAKLAYKIAEIKDIMDGYEYVCVRFAELPRLVVC